MKLYRDVLPFIKLPAELPFFDERRASASMWIPEQNFKLFRLTLFFEEIASRTGFPQNVYRRLHGVALAQGHQLCALGPEARIPRHHELEIGLQLLDDYLRIAPLSLHAFTLFATAKRIGKF